MNIQRVKERYEAELLLNSNVVGVGIGTKIIKGISTQRQCIKIYVQEKLPKNKLQNNELIPRKLNGIETDVEEVGRLKAQNTLILSPSGRGKGEGKKKSYQ